MTGFLASVMNLHEARIAQRARADIIDLKNPNCGALGAVSDQTVQEVVDALQGRAVTSATVGDLPADPELILLETRTKAQCGVDYVKIGMFSQQHIDHCLPALHTACQQGIAVIAVLFADLDLDTAHALKRCAEYGFTGVMLDTADKSAGGLLQHCTVAQLQDFVTLARKQKLLSGLAGSLRQEDIQTLLPLAADYLGFRTALCCQTERTQAIELEAALQVRQLLPVAEEVRAKIA